MQETIVIFLHDHNHNQPSWCVVSDNDTVSQCVFDGHPDALAKLSDNKKVIVIIPAIDVTLTKTHLPKMSDSRFLQAIPFALEDQLVGELESLHFAVSENNTDNERVVAIIAHEKMQFWLNLLQSWSVDADQLIPSIFVLPHHHNEWAILFSDPCLVRTGVLNGFACDSVNLLNLLELAFHSSANKPKHLHIENMKSESLSTQLQNFHVSATEKMISLEQALSTHAEQIVKFPGINLLQGKYAKKRYSFLQTSKVTKISVYLGVLWLALLFLYPLGSFLILNQRATALEQDIAQIYKKNFPQASRIIAPKLRMQEKLDKQNNEDRENQPFLYLAFIGKGLDATSNVELKRLDYQNNQVTLEIIADTSQDFSAFADFLTQQGLTVKQQNANLVGSRINATLLIE